ncbi:MAG: DUF4179 domain-containing protein [Acetatifactor sp.]|nr:DUF4179 domain-containing protein [Acetatifactor sp.]
MKKKKIDMYRKVPEMFHTRLCDTLDNLEEERSVVPFRGKKFVAIAAASVLACAGLTVGAAALFDWHPTASERFGTERELENKLTAQGAAIPENSTVTADGVTFEAVQAIRTDDYYYLLMNMKLPEGFEWNDDMGIEETNVEGLPKDIYAGHVTNWAGEPDAENRIPVEVQLFVDGNMPLGDQVTLQFSNLAQYEKTDHVETVLEGQWELSFVLPQEADTLVYQTKSVLAVGTHELLIDSVEISPFQIRLYTEETAAMHAVAYSPIRLTGLEYTDGSVIEDMTLALGMSGMRDGDGGFGFRMDLDNAVDPEKVAALHFTECEEEFVLVLNGSDAGESHAQVQNMTKLSEILASLGGAEKVTDLQILDVDSGNVILADDDHIYLWDAECDNAMCLITLSEHGYSAKAGGEFIKMYSGDTIFIHPTADSDHVVICAPGTESETWEIWEMPAESLWPYQYEYMWEDCFQEIGKLVPDAGKNYCAEAFMSKNQWYALYSEDGTAEKTELILMKD